MASVKIRGLDARHLHDGVDGTITVEVGGVDILEITATGIEMVDGSAVFTGPLTGAVTGNVTGNTSGQHTATAVGLTTAEIGADGGATITTVEEGDGLWHRTTLTCTATPMTFGDEGGQGQYGGVKVYDFPAGLLLFAAAVIDGSMTLAAPAIDAWAGDVGLGTAAPTDYQSGVNAAGVALLDSTAVGPASTKVAALDALTTATPLTESPVRRIDGTSDAADLYLNLRIDDNAAHDDTITGTFTGTIVFVWCKVGTL